MCTFFVIVLVCTFVCDTTFVMYKKLCEKNITFYECENMNADL